MTMTLTTPPRGTEVAASAPATVSRAISPLPLYCDWPMGTRSSAELMALHLTLQLQENTSARMIPVMAPLLGVDGLAPAAQQAVARVFEVARAEIPRIVRASDRATIPAVALHLLGDALEGMPQPLPMPARHNVGVVQTCDTRIDAEALARVAHMDLMLAGSSWMREVLVSAGVATVGVVPTGIDTTLFTPGKKSGHLSQRFVIFSGGRLDYRKGQDIVVAAVKIFCQRHPETLLLTTWQSPLPETAGSIVRSGHTPAAPEYYGTAIKVHEWAVANGLRADSVADLGVLAPAALAVVLREADVALFPNRAETDMNPMVLECMASGVPVILSANTGHLDVSDDERCYPLRAQTPVCDAALNSDLEGWGESSVEEILAQLEAVCTRTSLAREKAAIAVEWAKQFAWDRTARRMVELVATVM